MPLVTKVFDILLPLALRAYFLIQIMTDSLEYIVSNRNIATGWNMRIMDSNFFTIAKLITTKIT